MTKKTPTKVPQPTAQKDLTLAGVVKDLHQRHDGHNVELQHATCVLCSSLKRLTD